MIFSGRGIPKVIRDRTNQLTPLLFTDLPSDGNEAKLEYERFYMERLHDENVFGYDPPFIERYVQFSQRFDVAVIFQNCVNRRTQSLKDAIIYVLELTFQPKQSMLKVLFNKTLLNLFAGKF